MNYIEIKLAFDQAEPWKDIFTTLLADAGCESFADGETEQELLAYMQEPFFDEKQMHQLLTEHDFDVKIDYAFAKIEDQDWNAVWESNYAPVTIAGRCHIRAPFHEPQPEIEHEIIIEPKMSFGTAHHETTSLMIEFLLEEEVAGKSLLDMGSGTGILAILAHRQGATPVVAIDNDEWAYRNNIENNTKNSISDMQVILGDASAIPDAQFDIILANINRNILLNDIPKYAASLKGKGLLFLSGFYAEPDLEILVAKCKEENLQLTSHKEKNRWVAAKFIKA